MHPLVTKALSPLTLALLTLAAPTAQAQLPIRTEIVASGFSSPILVLTPPGDPRLFVVEQTGKVKVIRDGVVLETPYIDVSEKLAPGGERGLLGMAFHPNYASNGHAYINYTEPTGHTVVERYDVSGDPDVALETPTPVLGPIEQPHQFHNGGCMAFGPDGMLFIGMGDGGHSNDMGAGHAPGGNAQSPLTLHGKLLRLDVDRPFPHVPLDNPYVNELGILNHIFAFGLREPWRFSFDRLTGDLYLGDVGQATREEVNYLAFEVYSDPNARDLNFGWRCLEGTQCTGLSGCTCASPELAAPLEEFDHTISCAVIGGYIYRGCAIPSLRGTYFYAGFCYGAPSRLFAFRHEDGIKGPTIELTTLLQPDGPQSISQVTSFGEDANGEIYICDRDGEIHKIVPKSITDCNENGIPDGCDITSGTSADLNNDGIPDECAGLSFPRRNEILRLLTQGPLLPF
jgi:hypothetical protein